MIVDDSTFETVIKSLDERMCTIKEAEIKHKEEDSKANFNDYLMNFFENKSNLFDWEKEILPKLNEDFPNILRLIFQNLSGRRCVSSFACRKRFRFLGLDESMGQ